MSALLIDELDVAAPIRQQPRRWRHVDRRPEARPQLVGLPGGRPAGVRAPEVGPGQSRVRPLASPASRPAAGSWQLTDRGIAVVTVFFLALLVIAAVVLVNGFLAVSNAPIVG